MRLDYRVGVLLAWTVAACGRSGGAGPGPGVTPDAGPTDVGAPQQVDAPSGTDARDGGGAALDVSPVLPTTDIGALRAAIAADRPEDADGFHTRWPTKYLTQLPYDPMSAANLDKIAASSFGLSEAERAKLARNGFVISARQSFPTFLYGYKTIYADHLPLYVSLDSILHAFHRSYDAALARVEQASLIPALETLLRNVHQALSGATGGAFSAEARADVDVYLTVARRLLGDTTAAPVAGGSATAIADLVTLAMAGTAVQTVSVFGVQRAMDFTQFTLRGHYTVGRLASYFRAMMWLGRTDLRFVEFDPFAGPDAPPRLNRRQLEGGLLLAALTSGPEMDRWRGVDEILQAFVGESDNMTVADVPKLLSALGVTSAQAALALPDQTLVQALQEGGYGIQRIASQILVVPAVGAGAPLDRVFLFFGQRFVIDSAVFSDLVFDRVKGTPKRMMPDPMDIAFAALGNNAAGPLLDGEVRKYPGYLPALHDTRRLVDTHGDDFWGGSLYTLWLSALRGFSAPGGDPTAIAGLPSVMKTEVWARRVLSSQLASWAELRHDTLLYAKQSYTAIPACVFPDAYVDPYPAAWAGLVRLARLGETLATRLNTGSDLGLRLLPAYFQNFAKVAETLKGMAEAELAGTPFTSEQLAFINETVDLVMQSAGSGPNKLPRGWYPRLFLDENDSYEADPTIADVHSNPAESQILHVATGSPRLMVITADTCQGPRAYAGVVSSYFTHIPNGYQRLNDQQWATQLTESPPANPTWVGDLIAN